MPARSRLVLPAITAWLVLLCACSTAPLRYEPLDALDLTARAISHTSGEFTVRAAVPSATEAERTFGIPLYNRGIQPVWLEIRNDGLWRARFAISSVDPLYFSPLEVAYMHKKRFSKQGLADLEKRLYDLALPRIIPAGETVSGFVFTHLSTGTKAFNADVFYAAIPPKFEHFTFFVSVPGFIPDHAEIDFARLYEEDERVSLTQDGLRYWLENAPCCTTDRDADGRGKPVNIVLVAKGPDLLKALLRAGWSETSYERNEAYLEAADYLYGRPPDAIFRKKSDRANDRAELAVWLTPAVSAGHPVWMAQLRHAIGRRFQLGEFFFGAQLDPDVNDGRNYLLQNLWYSQGLEALAFSRSTLKSTASQTDLNFRGNPFISDGLRFVMWVAEGTIALSDMTMIHWDSPFEDE